MKEKTALMFQEGYFHSKSGQNSNPQNFNDWQYKKKPSKNQFHCSSLETFSKDNFEILNLNYIK